MSELTDLRDWCRTQATQITRTLTALDEDMPLATISDPDVRTIETTNRAALARERALWTDQADAIDHWLNRSHDDDVLDGAHGLFDHTIGLG